jgi:hypothetical protein
MTSCLKKMLHSHEVLAISQKNTKEKKEKIGTASSI